MLHHVNLPAYSVQFTAILDFQRRVLDFACDPATPAPITEAAVLAAFPVEGVWFWERLYYHREPTKLYNRFSELVTYAKRHPDLRRRLRWCFVNDTTFHNRIDDVNFRFWYRKLISKEAHEIIKPLMEHFYEPLFGGESGFPQCVHGLADNFNRKAMLEAFNEANRRLLVCPACGGVLEDPEVDHFFPKSLYPLLSMHPSNLTPICDKCNEKKLHGDPGNDGTQVDRHDKAVNAPLLHTFLPYQRPVLGNAHVQVTRNDVNAHKCELVEQDGSRSRRVKTFSKLFDLDNRWNKRLSVVIGSIRDVVSDTGKFDRQRRRGELTHEDIREFAEIMYEQRIEKLTEMPDYVLHESYLKYALADDGELNDLFSYYADQS